MKDNSATPAMDDQPNRGGAWADGDVVDLGTAPDGAAGIPAAAEGPGFDPRLLHIFCLSQKVIFITFT